MDDHTQAHIIAAENILGWAIEAAKKDGESTLALVKAIQAHTRAQMAIATALTEVAAAIRETRS
ncbi:hypothetical protein [Nonomuraea sp. NPDC050202]|uniref:hypothetical protein n=1 Tax=Nonomuraea sp. NPDC050202 TaxID=3155035 RepID=UPI0033D5BFF0